jgi:hypothetical protein
VLFSGDATPHRDAHGMAPVPSGAFVWVADRAANLAEVFHARTGARVGPVTLTGAWSDDPTPDLVDRAPDDALLFVSLRGPNPLSGDPHVSTGTTPGLMVLRLRRGGATGEVAALLRISNVDAGGVERADPHAVRVRRVR